MRNSTCCGVLARLIFNLKKKFFHNQKDQAIGFLNLTAFVKFEEKSSKYEPSDRVFYYYYEQIDCR